MKTKQLLLLLNLLVFNITLAGDPLSSFTKINSDVVVGSSNPHDIITQTLTLTTSQKVLIIADGRYFPYTSNGIAQVNIQIDNNNSYSNNSIIDWSSSTNPVQHTFNCIASTTLAPGIHTIKLIAFTHPSTPGTNFKIGSESGLSILVNPAPNMISSKLTNV